GATRRRHVEERGLDPGGRSRDLAHAGTDRGRRARGGARRARSGGAGLARRARAHARGWHDSNAECADRTVRAARNDARDAAAPGPSVVALRGYRTRRESLAPGDASALP